jgi:hypothetical protein
MGFLGRLLLQAALPMGILTQSLGLPQIAAADPALPNQSTPSSDCPIILRNYQRQGYEIKHATNNIAIWTKTKGDLERRISVLANSHSANTHHLQMQSIELSARIQTLQVLCPIFQSTKPDCRRLSMHQKQLATYQRKLTLATRAFERKNSRMQSQLTKATNNLATYQSRKFDAESARGSLRSTLQSQCPQYRLDGY